MKTLFSRFGKWKTIIVLIFLGTVLSVVLFISPIAKYLIVKNSKEWIGRQVLIDNLFINVFAGKISIEELKILEPEEDTVFVSLGTGVINVTLYKLVTGVYEISELSLHKLNIRVVQDQNGFNFDDLLISDDSDPDTLHTDPVKYILKNISITDSHLDYNGIHYEVKQSISSINFACESIAWNLPRSEFAISFGLGTGGDISIDLNIDKEELSYLADLKIQKLELGFTEPYLREFIKIKSFEGYLNSDLLLAGKLNESTDIGASGVFSLNDMVISDPDADTLISVGEFICEFDSLNLKNNLIDLGLFYINEPFIDFELYEGEKNNFTLLMQHDTVAAESAGNAEEIADNPFEILASYASDLTNAYVLNSFNVDSFAIQNGRILYQDFTLLESFVYDFTEMKIECSSLNSSKPKIEFNMSSVLNKTGTFEALLSVDPNDYYEMDLYYKITGVELPHVSPYSKFYVSYPFYSGVVQFESTTTIRNKILNSNNKIFIERVELGEKYKHKDAMDLPLRLAVALLRDRHGNIDLDLPITGDLNDPDYHVGKLIWQVLKNIIVKAATAPYHLLSGMLGVDEAQLKGFGFEYLDSTLIKNQTDNLDAIVKVINEKPGLNVVIAQYNEPAIEELRYALTAAKERYWKAKNTKEATYQLTKTEIEDLRSITVNDSLFVEWVDSEIGQKTFELPTEEKMIVLIGKEQTTAIVKELEIKRNELVRNYLTSAGVDSTRFKVYTEDPLKIPAEESRPKFVFTFEPGKTNQDDEQ